VNDIVSPGGAGITTTTFSSWGPADDGRIKPDIVANGFRLFSTDDADDAAYLDLSGTSMASPTASGIACLVAQLFKEKHGGAATSAELKALLIHGNGRRCSRARPDLWLGLDPCLASWPGNQLQWRACYP
jgi:subtilisin family serine protease